MPVKMNDTFIAREEELATIKTHLEKAADSKGSTLLLTGEPGIGKSVLTDAACDIAREAGFKIFRGAELKESTRPFNVLTQAFSRLTSKPLFEEQESVSFAEVLAINSAGLLMAKASAEEGKLDADIFAGMLTAVQSFVRDSFDSSGSMDANLGRLEYGDMKILIENGKHLFITAVLVGQEHEDMAGVLRSTIRDLEENYGELLSTWSGNMSEMEPVLKELDELARRQFLVRRDLAHVNLENEIYRISDTALEALQNECTRNPVLLVLEDVHWSSEESLKVVEYLVRNSIGMPLIVLCSARRSESGHFETFRERLLPDGTVKELALTGFDILTLNRMIDINFSPNKFPQSLYENLFSRTEGNPLFALELARHLRDSGAITQGDDGYVFNEMNISLPDTVEDLIASRLDTLSPEILLIAEVASCIGRVFDVPVLSGISLLRNAGTDIQALNSTGIVNFNEGKGTFSHGLFQEVVYKSISSRWKAKYHRELGNYYESNFAGNLDDVIFELARHFSNTPEHQKTLVYCIRAGEKAESSFAAEQAIDYYEKALPACKNDNAKTAMLHDRMGDLCFILSDCKGAIIHYSAAMECFDDRTAKAEMHRKIADSYEKMSEYDKAKEEAIKGLDQLSGEDNPVEARLLMSIGRVQMRQGDYPAAIDNLSKAASSAERHGSKMDLGTTEHLLGSVHLHKGEFPEARTHFEKAVAIRTEIGDISGVAASQNNIGNVLARTGEWEKALVYYTTSCETDARLGDKLGHASTLTNIASVHLSMGKPDEAIPILEESIVIEKKIGDKRGLAISLINLNLAHYLRGEYAKSINILTEALDICEKNSLKYECIFCYNGLCELYSLVGKAAEGLGFAQKSLALSREMGTKEGEAMSLMNLGAAQRESGDLESSGPNLENALAMMEEISHNQIFDACLELAMLLKITGKKERARSFAERALTGYEKNKDERNMARCRKLLDEIG